jgi:hypothetical protein
MATNLPVLPAVPAAQATPISKIADRLMSGTRVTIRGRLAADPELRYTDAGVAWTRMRVELRGTEGPILQVVLASGQVAEGSAERLRTGDQVRVDGRLRGRRWIGDDGLGCYDVDIMASTVEFVCLMPLDSALAELELSAALVLLAKQEEGSIHEALGRLHRALKTVQDARELAVELTAATGRPLLRVLDGGLSPASPPSAA